MFSFNKYANDDFGIGMNVKMNHFFEEDAHFSKNHDFYHNLLSDYYPLHEGGAELGQAAEDHDQYPPEKLGGDENAPAENDETPEEELDVDPEEMGEPDEYVPGLEDELDNEHEDEDVPESEEDAYSPSKEN